MEFVLIMPWMTKKPRYLMESVYFIFSLDFRCIRCSFFLLTLAFVRLCGLYILLYGWVTTTSTSSPRYDLSSTYASVKARAYLAVCIYKMCDFSDWEKDPLHNTLQAWFLLSRETRKTRPSVISYRKSRRLVEATSACKSRKYKGNKLDKFVDKLFEKSFTILLIYIVSY